MLSALIDVATLITLTPEQLEQQIQLRANDCSQAMTAHDFKRAQRAHTRLAVAEMFWEARRPRAAYP